MSLNQQTGTLYVVPTPIGNLEDMTLRGIRVLKEVTRILAEDTRHSGVLCQHFGISTPLLSFNEHNISSRLSGILADLAQGKSLALVSDAGLPGICDPGAVLIQEAVARDIPVVVLPGASAVLTALVGSGLAADVFIFSGFLDKKSGPRTRFLATLKQEKRTLICFESPQRLVATLADIVAILGADRPVVVARELTKRFETYHRGRAEGVLAHFRQTLPKGEVVLLIGGAIGADALGWEQAVVLLTEQLQQEMSLRDVVAAVAERTGVSRTRLYRHAVELRALHVQE